jgi:hypothetical protein
MRRESKKPRTSGDDYVGQIELDGEQLLLCTPAVRTGNGDRVVKPTWARVVPRHTE